MNKKPNREKPERLTTEEVEAALHAALRDEGRLFPTTDEEIAELEESLDLMAVPTPDANGFLAKLRKQRASKVVPMLTQEAVKTAKQNLAMAARNGEAIKDIPEDVRRRMDGLRRQYAWTGNARVGIRLVQSRARKSGASRRRRVRPRTNLPLHNRGGHNAGRGKSAHGTLLRQRWNSAMAGRKRSACN